MKKPFERPVLVDQIAQVIRDDILRGALQPGEHITVAPLAKKLGVSHIPVREAMRRLEAESLVSTVPHQGTVVADVRLEELHEIYDLRRLIEGETVERAGLSYSDEDVAAIEAAMKRLWEADPEDPDGDFWQAHRNFHWTVLAPALDPWRERILGLLWQSAERYHRLFTLVFGSLEEAHKEHQALTETAKRSDPEQMRSILLSHLHRTEETVTTGYLESIRAQTADA